MKKATKNFTTVKVKKNKPLPLVEVPKIETSKELVQRKLKSKDFKSKKKPF